MRFDTDTLRSAAQIAANEGHYGWGNTMEDAANELDRLYAFIGRQFPGFDVDEAIALHDTEEQEA